jgi:hypothetical protein
MDCSKSASVLRLLILGVWSQGEVGWIVSESTWLVCPGFTDVFVRRQASEGLQPLSKVVGV